MTKYSEDEKVLIAYACSWILSGLFLLLLLPFLLEKN